MAKIQKPGPYAVGFGILFLAIAVFCLYSGTVLLVRKYGGTTVKASILSCGYGPATGGHTQVCRGRWKVEEDGRTRTVEGPIEGPSVPRVGDQLEVVVVGGRGFSKQLSSGLGYPALFFGLVFLANAVMMFLGLFKQ